MTVGTNPQTPAIAVLLNKHLDQYVQKSKRTKAKRTKAKRIVARRTPPLPGGKKAFLELNDDLRIVMYGLGALIASADGVTNKESRALRMVANFLKVPNPARRHIDKTLLGASSPAAALVALFEAYREVRKQFVEPDSTQLRSEEPASRTERVRSLAQESIFELPMLGASEVSALLGSRSENQRQYAATLRRRGALLGLRRGNRYVYPKFQFDPKTRQVYPAVEAVGEILDAARDPWGAVSWWTSPSPRLPGGQAPMQLLGTPKASSDLPALARGMVEIAG